jgi:hypothetical protein
MDLQRFLDIIRQIKPFFFETRFFIKYKTYSKSQFKFVLQYVLPAARKTTKNFNINCINFSSKTMYSICLYKFFFLLLNMTFKHKFLNCKANSLKSKKKIKICKNNSNRRSKINKITIFFCFASQKVFYSNPIVL